MSDLASELSALAALDRAGLAARWEEVFGSPAPRRCQSPLLQGALAWRLQLQHSGQSPGDLAPAFPDTAYTQCSAGCSG